MKKKIQEVIKKAVSLTTMMALAFGVVQMNFMQKYKADAAESQQNIFTEELEEDSLLLDKIMELPVKYREVLYLYYYEEYSIREISELLSRKESTIQTQLAAARQKLKNILGKEKQ